MLRDHAPATVILIVVIFFSLFITGCKPFVKINAFYPAEKPVSGKFEKGSSVHIRDAYFVDWAYPNEKNLKKHFPGNTEILKFRYLALQYHGCIFEYYIGEKKNKFLVMVPHSRPGTVSKIKNLYVSKDPVTIYMTYLTHFPKTMWEFPQKSYPAMPVFMLQSIF